VEEERKNSNPSREDLLHLETCRSEGILQRREPNLRETKETEWKKLLLAESEEIEGPLGGRLSSQKY